MFLNLEMLIGRDAILRIHMINEKYDRVLKGNIDLKNFIYVMLNPIKVLILIAVVSTQIPNYIGTALMLFEWTCRIFELVFYRKIHDIIDSNNQISKENRLLCCTNYNLLISFFERTILDIFNKVFYYLFIFAVVASERYVQGFLLVVLRMNIEETKETTKAYLIIYLKEFIKEDWGNYGIAKC